MLQTVEALLLASTTASMVLC